MVDVVGVGDAGTVGVENSVVVTTTVVLAGLGSGEVMVIVVDLSSLQPNQPQRIQVVVVIVVVNVVAGALDVVDSSRQPQKPGVLQVSVRVRVEELFVEVVLLALEVVVVSVPLLS